MLSNVLALDVGEQRVGVAIARAGLRVALPLMTLERPAVDFWQQLLMCLKQNDVTDIVIGLPRGLDGQETAQTAAAQAFGQELATQTDAKIHWQDEAVTSVNAEEILKNSGKSYQKADIDAMAATLILSDYLETVKVTA